MVEFPPPNLSQTSDVGEFDHLSLSDGYSPGGAGTSSRPSSGGYNRSRNRQYNHQNQKLPSPPVIGARRSLSDNMNQMSAANAQGHPLPPPQRHTGGYYSQSSSTSSQGSVKSGGGGQLQGAWATPGKSGATVVRSGSSSRNLSLNRDLSLSPRVVGGGGGGSSCGTASPMFSLSRYSSASSLTSSGSVTPASSGTRTPVSSQPPRGSHYALISSSASKLEKMKREDTVAQHHYGHNGGGRGERGSGRGGGYPLKHSVSGPEIPDASSRRGWKRTQSQQVLYRENDSQRVNTPPRRNMSSQNFQQMRGHERSRPVGGTSGGGVSRPLSEEYDSGAPPTLTSDREGGELQPRSYSDSQSQRSSGGVRRWHQQSQSGRSGQYYQKGHQSSRGRGATGRGNRGRGRDK